MRLVTIVLALVPVLVGCNRFVLRSQVETRLDTTPVSPTAGNVRPVVVQAGASRIAVLDVDGLILNTPFVGPLSVGENPVALFREKLEAVACDPCVKAVVLRVNSPGGGVAACIAMRHDLERFRERSKLPVIACLMDTATGGAYYLASGADQVVAGPATVTGGIGVLLNLFNLQDLMAQFNIIPQSIKAGDLTEIGTSARKLTDDEKKLLQAMADEFHGQLIADVKRARPAATEAATFDGRIFTGTQAKAKGLVDHIGDLDEAIQLAAGMGCPGLTARPGVVMYRRGNDPARSVYAITPNVPLQGSGLLPNLPGLDRSKLPTFLSVWQPELTLEKMGGK
ncbi:signal peptide peptidase SppA [Frigoriglobus tundricola]|uniref:Signal peptide peptidase SppA (Protease 4) n=1 Tax=Frigoriglobus tundricola TaxID=2774151 RepID=A0A6M5YKL7_9BACT|nr:signal peptide peptidase SppA [Frigoriglobus tundricola]QJW93890.1 Signal peptide peptidase SppA (protease 4) [Frigoriglobus tundricola]